MEVKLSFYDSEERFTKRQRGAIQRAIRRAAVRSCATLGIKSVDFQVRPSKAVIPETGEVGYARPKAIYSFIDPNRVEEAIASGALAAQVYHETHHVRRMRTVGYGRLLLKQAISEGLATIYAEEMFPVFVAPWGQYNDKEIARLLNIFKPNVPRKIRSEREHARWFFGDGEPRWLGYKVGAYIVRQTKEKNPGLTAAELVDVPAEKILKMSGVV